MKPQAEEDPLQAIQKLLIAVAVVVGSYLFTQWLAQTPSSTPGFWFLLAASGPSLLYFLAHGGSLALWAIGACVVVAPLVLAVAKAQSGVRPLVFAALAWLSLCLLFGVPYLLGALA